MKRFNRTLSEMLSMRVKKSEKDWDEKIPYALFAFQTCIQESTQESPFFLLYGRDPKMPSHKFSLPLLRGFE